MSTDQQPTAHDPRYDGLYQRGGSASVQGNGSAPVHPAAEQPRTTTVPPTSNDDHRLVDATAAEQGPDSLIREVGPRPEAPEEPMRARNPFDVWVWVVAAALTVLGVYFLTAPIVYAEAAAEAMMSQSSAGMYVPPWFQQTMWAAPILILLGVGTAVVQLFVLSIRHTLRVR